MDRRMQYPGAIPLADDPLEIQTNVMKAIGYSLEAVAGPGPWVTGMACGPTTPASMSVIIDRGAITSLSVVDGSPFSTLAASSDALVKMGIRAQPGTIALTAPTTTGQSQAFLIEATLSEVDTDAIVLPYYNAASPTVPFAGPGNAGTAQNTHRRQTVALQVVAGTPATTGSQTVPATTTGWTALYVVTLNAGQTTITSSSIAVAPYAPFLLDLNHRVENGSGIGQLGNKIKIGWSGTDLKATVDATDLGNIAFQGRAAGNRVGTSYTPATGQTYTNTLTFTPAVAGVLYVIGTVNLAGSLIGTGGPQVQPYGCAHQLLVGGTPIAYDNVVGSVTTHGITTVAGGSAISVQQKYATLTGVTNPWVAVSQILTFVFVPA